MFLCLEKKLVEILLSSKFDEKLAWKDESSFGENSEHADKSP